MKSSWIFWLFGLFLFVLFLIPFSILSTELTEYKDKTNSEIKYLNFKIDSLENQLKNKKDTLIIKPIKIEFYDSKSA